MRFDRTDGLSSSSSSSSSIGAAERLAPLGPVVVMGTVLSLSPGSRKAAARGPDKLAELAVQKPLEAREEDEEKDGKKKKKKKRHPVLLHALSWKKRLVAARAKRKGGKKVKPAVSDSGHVQREQREQSATDGRHRALKVGQRHGPIPVPVPTVPDHTQNQKQGRPDLIISPRRVVVQVGVRAYERVRASFSIVCFWSGVKYESNPRV